MTECYGNKSHKHRCEPGSMPEPGDWQGSALSIASSECMP